MNIKVNGEDQTIEQDAISVTELLKISHVAQPEMVSVQVNGEFLNKDDYANKQIKDNDEVDFIYFMGGGRR